MMTTIEIDAIRSALTMNGIVYQGDVGKLIITSLFDKGYIENIWIGAYRVTSAGRQALKAA